MKRFIGRRILRYDSVDSTNDIAFDLGEKGQKEGLCVLAEYQRKGRGRLGRQWVSPRAKNLILSVLLRPALLPADLSKLTLTAAVSIVKTIHQTTGKTLGIRWPNDIYYQKNKVAGILTEMDAESDRVNFAVVGIGINVNAEKKELPPHSISLKEITGEALSRPHFARKLLRQLESDYLKLKAGRFKELSRDWEEFSLTSGRRVSVKLLNRKIEGRAMGIDADGALWIRKDNGLQEKILAGDIQHLE